MTVLLHLGFRRLERFLADEEGVSLILSAVFIPVMVLACALSIDIALSLSERSSMQQAADNAVRSAAITDQVNGSTLADVQNEARGVAAANGFQHGVDAVDVTVNIPPTSGNLKSDASAVEVVVTKIRNNLLGGFVGKTSTIKARAVAGFGAAPCIVALRNNSTGTTGISFNGNGSVVFKCALYSNSTNTTKSIGSSGSVNVTTPYAGMAGCSTASISNMHCNINEVPNPYAAVAALVPTAAPSGTSAASKSGSTYSCANSKGCTVTGSSITGSPTFKTGTYFISGALAIANGAQFTATAATIWISGGLSMGASAKLTANTSVFLFPSTLTGAKAGFQVTGSSTTSVLTPPTSGPYAGFSIVDVSNPPTNSPVSVGWIGSSSDVTLSGIILAPNNDLKFGGSTDLSKGTCFSLVAGTITFGGSTSIGNSCLLKSANLSGFAGGDLAE